MGDASNCGGPYGNDGRPDFRLYGPQITRCITSLPQSIEEVYLEINGEGLSCDDDSDFDPICGLVPKLFGPESPVKRLHTCDIHAWISDIDGGLGQIPEKAVFYRRLPFDEDPTNSKKRDIWTSRMDCAHQGDWDWVITKEYKELEGDFEGVDAEEVWLGGFLFEPPDQMWTGKRRRWPKPDYSWPGYVNLVNGYPMFRERP